MSERIVLDTNILISALISGNGPPAKLLETVRQRRVTLITSQYQLDELRDVLGRKGLQRFIKANEARTLLSMMNAIAEVVTDLPVIDISPDPKDNPILATAIAGKATKLVSGDKTDLLALKEIKGIVILSARDAFERLS